MQLTQGVTYAVVVSNFGGADEYGNSAVSPNAVGPGLTLVGENFSSTSGTPTGYNLGNANFGAASFGYDIGTSSPSPEPASLSVLGLVGLGAMRRRRSC